MTSFKEYLYEQMQDSEIKSEYEALEQEFAIIKAMIEARKNIGLTTYVEAAF